jgi:hypothetical protein
MGCHQSQSIFSSLWSFSTCLCSFAAALLLRHSEKVPSSSLRQRHRGAGTFPKPSTAVKSCPKQAEAVHHPPLRRLTVDSTPLISSRPAATSPSWALGCAALRPASQAPWRLAPPSTAGLLPPECAVVLAKPWRVSHRPTASIWVSTQPASSPTHPLHRSRYRLLKSAGAATSRAPWVSSPASTVGCQPMETVGPLGWARPSHQQKRPKCTMDFHNIQLN